MLIIKKNSSEYRQWLRHRNEKNLRSRTRIKTRKKSAKNSNTDKNTEKSPRAKMKFSDEQVKFEAPINFSFINNAEETTQFFNQLLDFLQESKNFGKRIFIDISKVGILTCDALMYLLAVVNNKSEALQSNFRFSGNAPIDPKINKRFEDSGFYKYVHRIKKSTKTHISNNNIKIVTGDNSDTTLAKQISDFVCEKAKVEKRMCGFLYNMMIELMSNTHKHAYNSGTILQPKWYCFAEYDKDDGLFFTFMDTGEGIPATVKKNFAEKLDVLNVKDECKYVVSALEGEFRTSTNKLYRGKGLPKIREFCTKNKIQDVRIITNKADVSVAENDIKAQDLNTPLTGTLYYWKIDIATLKGDVCVK